MCKAWLTVIKRAAISRKSSKVKKDWQTMNNTHIHRPMYTSPGMEHMRHTIGDVNRTPAVESHRVMPATVDVDLDFNKEGITNDRALYRHSDSRNG